MPPEYPFVPNRLVSTKKFSNEGRRFSSCRCRRQLDTETRHPRVENDRPHPGSGSFIVMSYVIFNWDRSWYACYRVSPLISAGTGDAEADRRSVWGISEILPSFRLHNDLFLHRSVWYQKFQYLMFTWRNMMRIWTRSLNMVRLYSKNVFSDHFHQFLDYHHH